MGKQKKNRQKKCFNRLTEPRPKTTDWRGEKTPVARAIEAEVLSVWIPEAFYVNALPNQETRGEP